jgi:hypothetical protein
MDPQACIDRILETFREYPSRVAMPADTRREVARLAYDLYCWEANGGFKPVVSASDMVVLRRRSTRLQYYVTVG